MLASSPFAMMSSLQHDVVAASIMSSQHRDVVAAS
jgi:hypothetical protein